ncbi:hypothetical protein HNP37_002969 [Flavobacterium nitrogenifigens]|uniref:Uncharacterized protein n=2 Tax=Flavobacterium TaxID=237 RepID=A0A7W7N8Y1_9FLAO|nr:MULTISPECIES: hypothetical protein [Flavobacterium]MBB4802894.1 hypothetical protein [Flavobacterium nitrogenifigens]MBB6387852.1 hypothetical protein [Flavobacterium notoginsengisoli]
MKLFKNILGGILVISVLLPMFLFLNPFLWGMRRAPEYIASAKLEKVLQRMKDEINTHENVEIDIYNNEASVWYFRDCENKKLDSLSNFKIEISEVKRDSFVRKKIEKYAPLIKKEIDCKCYDSLVFTYKIKGSEFVSGFKMK